MAKITGLLHKKGFEPMFPTDGYCAKLTANPGAWMQGQGWRTEAQLKHLEEKRTRRKEGINRKTKHHTHMI